MKRVFVKPLDGRQPVYPRSRRRLPREGAEVHLDVYWLRRVRDGDVEITDPPRPPAKRAKRSSSEREGGHRAD